MKRIAALFLVSALTLIARADVWGQAQEVPAPVVIERASSEPLARSASSSA